MSTIAEVARGAGVSVATVSHDLNNTRYISSEKIQRVGDVIAAIGSTPTSLARWLTLASTGTARIVIAAISNPDFHLRASLRVRRSGGAPA